MSTLDPIDSATPAPEFEHPEQPSSRRGVTGWLISGTTHALVITLLALAYQVVKQETVFEPPPFRAIPPPPAPVKPLPPTPIETPQTQVQVPLPEAPEITPKELMTIDDHIVERETEIESEVPKGTNSVADVATANDSNAFVMAIGPAGNSAGLLGTPGGGGKYRRGIIGKMSGPIGTVATIDRALRWFKRHQHPTGQWDPQTYFKNCTTGTKCEPAPGQRDGQVAGITGYALLCFLVSGYDQATPNVHQTTVKHAVAWLLDHQAADGSWGRNYENAVVTMALAEDFAMTSDPVVGAAAQRGVDVILKRQNQDIAAKSGSSTNSDGSGLGWDYVDASARNDASVTGWNTMALKSALAAGLKVKTGLQGAKRWLDASWKASNPGWEKLDPYHGESRFPYTWTTGTNSVDISPGPADEKDLACVGGMCAVFLGHLAGDPMLETLTNYTLKHQLPAAWPCNTYYLYYNTMAMFQVGGDKWKTWQKQAIPMVISAQRQSDDCFDGSWDWEGTKFPGNDVGRTLSTAYACLTLEVYFHWNRLSELH